MANTCSCGVLDLAKGSEWSDSIFDGMTAHFFDGTPCRVVPCSPEEPCSAPNDVHVEMFGGCWVMRAVFHGRKNWTGGRIVDPELEQEARELYEGAGHMEGDLSWTEITESGRSAFRQEAAKRRARQ